PVEKLKPNTGKPVDQLEYSRAISCLMYAMTRTRPDIAYAVGRLSSTLPLMDCSILLRRRRTPYVSYNMYPLPLGAHVDLIVPVFLKELICKVLGILVPLLELNRFGILLGELGKGQIAYDGWPFVFAVSGQMTHLVGGSISPEGFLPSILLLAVIIVVDAIVVTVVL
nr:zinc finger, CCHC-type [Tanacetum cinerariifolium]